MYAINKDNTCCQRSETNSSVANEVKQTHLLPKQLTACCLKDTIREMFLYEDNMFLLGCTQQVHMRAISNFKACCGFAPSIRRRRDELTGGSYSCEALLSKHVDDDLPHGIVIFLLRASQRCSLGSIFFEHEYRGPQ
jgi:hypothetical protein